MIGPDRRWLRTDGPAAWGLPPAPRGNSSTLPASGWSHVPARDRTRGTGLRVRVDHRLSVTSARGDRQRSLDVERYEGVGVLSARRPFSLVALGAQSLHVRAVIGDNWALT